MFYGCISVRFRDGIPTLNMNESYTVHSLDPDVKNPKSRIRTGDVVLIKTPGYPIVKLVVSRYKAYSGQLGGTIVGRAAFFDPINNQTPFADMNTAQGGLAPA